MQTEASAVETTETLESTTDDIETVETTETGETTEATESTTETTEKADGWGDDWRQQYAGDDEKMQKRLERYASPKAALDALVAAQNKIASGELKSVLPPDASDEERAEWRADNGVPESPDGYELNLGEGVVIGEADKPLVDSFLEAAHESNLHPSQVNEVMGWYFDAQEQQALERETQDEQMRQTFEEELRAEMGQDFRRNVQLATNIIPDELKEKFIFARLADENSTPLGSDPDVIRWLTGLAREINPIATVVPGSGANAMQAIESEIATLKGMMGDRESEYWKGPKSQEHQARYRELIAAQQKHG